MRYGSITIVHIRQVNVAEEAFENESRKPKIAFSTIHPGDC